MWTHPEIDPIAFSFGPLAVHWYGLMYLVAFLLAWAIGVQSAKKRESPVVPKQVEDLMFYGALGVVIGGRLGYVFFYNFDAFIEEPSSMFRIWEGGMAFHGGLLGVVAAMWLYARSLSQPFLKVMDFVAPLVPPGLFFGRLGNFIGQELWGRETSVAWGVVFPKDPELLTRHPSQLYQAFLEGAVIFVVLYWYSRKPRPLGAVCSLFVFLYGLFRFAAEFFREPDAHIQFDLFDWMTRGQLLSIPMIFVGLGVFVWAYYRHQQKHA